ncbi:hypothetical protein GCM10009550_15990 [Actinocorallia libanotica]|uniref:Uncharacterized protein n=1 Tax=Actinocorallia libanotica TaxID=46162 RepID=A0ABN1QKM6_9ACTN
MAAVQGEHDRRDLGQDAGEQGSTVQTHHSSLNEIIVSIDTPISICGQGVTYFFVALCRRAAEAGSWNSGDAGRCIGSGGAFRAVSSGFANMLGGLPPPRREPGGAIGEDPAAALP